MEKEKVTELVAKAQAGDLEAMEKLLEQAHTSVSYQCRKMLKHPEDAEDLTQEILLTVYTKLDSLQEPAAFRGWLSRITATRCMNALSRTQVDLQFAEDEEGNSVLDSLEALDEHQIPDKALDNAETARMIDEIVTGLPEAQRMSTLMYYYNEMSVKEIAQLMSVPENTVKGRLNLARKSIKEKVLDYEKQGIKLYSVSVLPLLWYFLRMSAEAQKDPAAAAACIAEVVAAGSAAAEAGVAAAESAEISGTATAGKAAARAISAKLVAGIAAGVIALGAAAAAIFLNEEVPLPAFICPHSWVEADCVTPKTCSRCQETEGEALGHSWIDADCENPEICTACDETQGEPLGHTWVEATCLVPKTCSVCDKIEGEPGEHSWIEANYQTPQTCSLCGQTEGDVLTPDFEKYGLKVIPAEMDVEYEYISTCYTDKTKKASGILTMSNYSTFFSDETHEGVEGYAWHTVTFEIDYYFDLEDRSNNNVWDYGVMVQSLYAQYYRISGFGDGSKGSEAGSNSFTLNYNGIDYTECMVNHTEHVFSGWHYGVNTYSCTFYWRVPEEYDGFILGYYDGGIDLGAGDLIYEVLDENTLYFRFPAAKAPQ